jgi:F1F0 ATPase subunit 2
MVNEIVTLVSAGVAGLLLGGFFFGGLWWTVRKGVSAKRPALLFYGQLGVADRCHRRGLCCCRRR